MNKERFMKLSQICWLFDQNLPMAIRGLKRVDCDIGHIQKLRFSENISRICCFSRSIFESFQSTTETIDHRFSRRCWRSEPDLLYKQRLKFVLTHMKTHIYSSLQSQMIGLITFFASNKFHNYAQIIWRHQCVYVTTPTSAVDSRLSFIRLLVLR